MAKLKIKFGFFSLLIIFSLLVSGNKLTYLTLLAVSIHESGHIVASKIFNISICELNFGFLGARLKTEDMLYSYSQEISLCLFGPIFNFLSAYIAYVILCFTNYNKENIKFFILSSILLGIINLLPIRTFDGGRIIESLFSYVLHPKKVYTIVNIFSFITIFCLWSVSVYFLLVYSSSLGLFVFSFSLFFSLFIDKES